MDTLKSVKAEQTVDPATFFFTKAVSEHALIMKEPGPGFDRPSAVRRLRHAAALPHGRRPDGLRHDELEGRRPGHRLPPRPADPQDEGDQGPARPRTRRREDPEDGKRRSSSASTRSSRSWRTSRRTAAGQRQQSGNCPPGGDGQAATAQQQHPGVRPQDDSLGGNGKGEGKIDMKKLNDTAAKWGKLTGEGTGRRHEGHDAATCRPSCATRWNGSSRNCPPAPDGGRRQVRFLQRAGCECIARPVSL